MGLKDYFKYAAAAIISGMDDLNAPNPFAPRMDNRNFGTNPKRCKSCTDFTYCKNFLNRNPMDVACREYKPKKK